jgi:hypothetical protein
LGLFEEAGIILKPKEKIVKRGAFKGEVPKGAKRSAWSGQLQLEWDYVRKGELVLTNKRLIAIGMKTYPYSGIVVYPDLTFKTLNAIREIDAGRFLLLLGTRYEATFEVDNASQWVSAIKEQCWREEPEESKEKERSESIKAKPQIPPPFSKTPSFCPYCGTQSTPDALFCSKCGKKLT